MAFRRILPLQAYLKERFDYDPVQGILIWKPRDRRCFKTDANCRRWNTRYAGKPAGLSKDYHYANVNLDRRIYLASRLIWKWAHGTDPSHLVDHASTDSRDDSLPNLRPATQSQNAMNQRLPRRNTTGVKHVYRCNRPGRWRVQIALEGRAYCFGEYAHIEDATIIAETFASVLHDAFSRRR